MRNGGTAQLRRTAPERGTVAQEHGGERVRLNRFELEDVITVSAAGPKKPVLSRCCPMSRRTSGMIRRQRFGEPMQHRGQRVDENRMRLPLARWRSCPVPAVPRASERARCSRGVGLWLRAPIEATRRPTAAPQDSNNRASVYLNSAPAPSPCIRAAEPVRSEAVS
jgi:hypothetical protein